jgi:dTDP-4-dehydrorhamnose reductase
VIYLAGMKFGSAGQEALTWALNCYLPGLVGRKYRRSRMVAFSTGNIYGLTPIGQGGSVETDFPNPLGDYAMSCLGRERILEHFSRTLAIPTAMIRLNYAVEPRYGVLVDIARQVWAQQPVAVGMGYFNAIWQAEANAMTLQAFAHAAAPPFFLNVAGPEILKVRQVAEKFGRLMGKTVRFEGEEGPVAFLSNGRRGYELMGTPQVTPDQMIAWIADWIMRGGATAGKPTHFEVRDGKF